MTALSESTRATRQARALVTSLVPPSRGVLRVVRVDRAEWPAEVLREAKGRPITGFYSGAWVHPISASVTSIGRGLQNDAVLLDPAVSREHARLLELSDGWWIENASEHNPLWVGEHEITPGNRRRIEPGEQFELGNTTLQFLAPRSPAAALLALAPPAGPLLAGADPGALMPIAALPTMPPHATSTYLPKGALEPLEPLFSEASSVTMGATNLLSPGVTLQFALSGKFGPRARWLLAVAGICIFLLSAALTLGLTALIGRTAFATGGAGRVLAALTIPLVPALGVALLVALLDRYEREPPLLLLAAFLWGAVIAIPPVLYLERTLNSALLALLGGDAGGVLGRATSLALSAGLTEESIKGAGLLVLLWVVRDEFDNVTDGVLYGALIGAGFALVENFVYFAQPRADLGVLIFGRVVLGWLGHSTFTALFGAGLGFARERHLGRWDWYGPLLGFVAGMLLHTFFDFVAFNAELASSSGALGDSAAWLSLLTVALDYVPLFGAQALLLRLVLNALDREAAIVRAYLADEVSRGVVTPDEYILLQDSARRDAAERQYGLSFGLRIYVTARSLHQTATGLAFRKWHVAQGDPPKATKRQPEEAYRERIARLRRSLQRRLSTQLRTNDLRAANPASRATRNLRLP